MTTEQPVQDDLDVAHLPGTNWGHTATDETTYVVGVLLALVLCSVAAGLVAGFMEGPAVGKRAATVFFLVGSVLAAAQIFQGAWPWLAMLALGVAGARWLVRRRAVGRSKR